MLHHGALGWRHIHIDGTKASNPTSNRNMEGMRDLYVHAKVKVLIVCRHMQDAVAKVIVWPFRVWPFYHVD